MNILAEIVETDLGLDTIQTEPMYRLRKAARAILLNDNGEVALLLVSKHNYHKLPGGGVEHGEDLMDALKREALEEVGANIIVGTAVGATLEYRDRHELLQISYGYIARVGSMDKPSLTDDEKEKGLLLKWMSMDEAIRRIQADDPVDYVGKFIRMRDYVLLMKAKEMMTN